MKITRRYRCLDCGKKFTRTMDVDAPEPECPSCSHQFQPPPDRIAAPAIVGTKARAVDAAYKIAEEDFGLTNLHDGNREGDVAYVSPPTEKVNPATIQRPGFLWGGASLGGSVQSTGQVNLASSRAAAQLAKAEGKSPMELLHKAKPKLRAIPLNKGG